MRSEKQTDRYHHRQHSIRKGRNAGVGDLSPSLGSATDVLPSHMLKARHCAGTCGCEANSRGSSAPLHDLGSSLRRGPWA